jgi:hypothetical protein
MAGDGNRLGPIVEAMEIEVSEIDGTPATLMP